jgi:hypothetical protein
MRAVLFSICLVVCLVACLVVACGPPAAPEHPASPWSAPTFFADIPADTPYVFASIDPLSDALRDRIYGGLGDSFAKSLANAGKLVKAEDEPWKRAVSAVIESLRGTDLTHWTETLGFGKSPRFAIYGLGLMPVLRWELADAGKLRAVMTKALAAAGGGVATGTVRGVPYWKIPGGATTWVFAVLDHELVVAAAPNATLDAQLPLILALEHPAHSLADTTEVPDALKKYGFNRFVYAAIELGRVADELAAMPSTGMASPECKTDLGRLAAYTPRIVSGYRHLDADGFAFGIVLETSPGIADALGRIRTQLPQIPREHAPIFEASAGVDLDAAVDAVRTAVHQLRNQPFHCAPLATMSEALDLVAQKLDEPLPPEMQGLRGADFVIDDFSIQPPGGSGAFLAIGSHVGQAVGKLFSLVPGLGGVSIPNDGAPIELPIGMHGIKDLDEAYIAVHDNVAALAIGTHSKDRVTKALGAPPDPHTPLMGFTWDVAKTLERYPTLWKDDTRTTMQHLKHIDMSLELVGNGLDFEIDAGWR